MSRNIKLPVIREKKVKRSGNPKLLALLFIFFIIIFIVLFFNSSFSRIDDIQIQGHHFLTEEEIGQALQIQLEDQFFAVSTSTLEERVKQIEIVERVHVTKVFPGHILVDVEEFPVVAYQITPNGNQAAILANGSEVPIDDQVIMFDKPIITGWSANDPVKLKLSQALAKIPQVMLDDISEIKPYDPTEAFPDKIKLYTRSFFEIITSVEYLPDKITYLDEIIDDRKSHGIHSGVITMLLADTYAPFEGEGNDTEINLEDDKNNN